MAALEAEDLPPFQAAIAAGVPTVMTTHITFPAVDGGLPATFSPAVIDGLLRSRLGFSGVTVSDDLEMAGSADNFSLLEGALLALRAGVDLILVSRMLLSERDIPGLMIDLERAEADGRLEKARVREAAGRVRKLKGKYLGSSGQPARESGREVLRCPRHLALLETIEKLLAKEEYHAG
jgi:beta-N-acetylhexosaminidase